MIDVSLTAHYHKKASMYFAITVYLIARTIKPTKSREENGPPNHLVALPRIHIHSTHRSYRE